MRQKEQKRGGFRISPTPLEATRALRPGPALAGVQVTVAICNVTGDVARLAAVHVSIIARQHVKAVAEVLAEGHANIHLKGIKVKLVVLTGIIHSFN